MRGLVLRLSRFYLQVFENFHMFAAVRPILRWRSWMELAQLDCVLPRYKNSVTLSAMPLSIFTGSTDGPYPRFGSLVRDRDPCMPRLDVVLNGRR